MQLDAPLHAQCSAVLPFAANAAPPSVRTVLPLAMLWMQLAQGTFFIKGHFDSPTHSHLLLRSRPGLSTFLDQAHLRITQDVLTGTGQKVLAIDGERSCSTISGVASRTLCAFGLNSCVSRAPLALVLAACGNRRAYRIPLVLLSRTSQSGVTLATIQRPDTAFNGVLTAAESAVASSLMVGLSHNQISQLRGRSARTIANQVHSIFVKTGALGRFAVIDWALASSVQAELAS